MRNSNACTPDLGAFKTGRGGGARIAELLGLDVGTAARGRRELLERDVEVERVRKAGGGRKPMGFMRSCISQDAAF